MDHKLDAFMDDNDIQADFMQVMEEDELTQSMLRELAHNKMVPVYSDAIDRHEFLGCGKIVSGPEHVNGYAGAQIGFCQVRMYDSNEKAGHWINMDLIQGDVVEDQGSTRKLEN